MKKATQRFIRILGLALVVCALSSCTPDPDDTITILKSGEYSQIDAFDSLLAAEDAGMPESTEIDGQVVAVEDQSGVLRLYYDDTQSIYGFTVAEESTQNTDFVYAMQSVVSAATGLVNAYPFGFTQTELYTLLPDEENILQWSELGTTADLLGTFRQESFYTGNNTPSLGRSGTLNEVIDGTTVKVGPLSRLVRDVDPLFSEDDVTVIVSDLMEQNFNLADLSGAIVSYFEESDSSVAFSLIACTSYYQGTLSVPKLSTDGVETTVDIENYAGDAVFYILITGPIGLVDTYTNSLAQKMDEQSLQYAQVSYYNQIDVVYEALTFDLINPLPSAKVLDEGSAEDVLSTANTLNLIERDNAFYTKVSGTQNIAMGSYVNLAAIADVPEGFCYSIQSVTLYSYQPATLVAETARGSETDVQETPDEAIDLGTWEICGKNEQQLVTDIVLEDWDTNEIGEVRDNAVLSTQERTSDVQASTSEGVLIVAEGRYVQYLGVGFDFGTDTGLSYGNTYCDCVEILIEPTSVLDTAAREVEVLEYSVSLIDFDKAIMSLSYSGGAYQWNQSSALAQQVASVVMTKTAMLDSFLAPISNMDYTNRASQQVTQVVYFVYETTSSR